MIKQRQFYYRKLYVLFELVKAMKGREVIFMDNEDNWKCIRGMWIKSVDYLKNTFFGMSKFLDKNYNIYISCAKYENIPPFTFNLANRSKETIIWFNNEALNLISDYDLLLDFDCKDSSKREKYLKEIYLFYRTLRKNNICFNMVFSGSNYQMIIPSFVYGFEKNEKRLEKTFIKPIYYAKAFKEVFNLKFLDIKGIGVFNKIMKCPYSLVEDRVVLPLSDFKGRDEIYNTKYILDRYILKNRGLCLFNNVTTTKAYMNFVKFCSKYNIEILGK